jgi:hypothetical protein
LTDSIKGCNFFLQLAKTIYQIEFGFFFFGFVFLSILILRDKESQTLTAHDLRKTKGFVLVSIYYLKTYLKDM